MNKNTFYNQLRFKVAGLGCFKFLPRLVLVVLAMLICVVSEQSAKAQFGVTINPYCVNYWTGINKTNTLALGSNYVSVVNADGVTTESFSLSGAPSGLTAVFAPSSLTNTTMVSLTLRATNVAAGYYPMSIVGSGGASASAPINLFVVPQWAQTNVNSTGVWSDNTKWTGGAVPLSTDSVYIDHTTVGPWTNVVDSSRTIQNLVYLGDGDEGAVNSLAVNTSINPGVTLSVIGTNGFSVGQKTKTSVRPVYAFGGDTLVVSNAAAKFSIQNASANATRYSRVDMSSLGNLNVTVRQMAIADSYENTDSADGANLVDFVMAKTNFITALYTDDYTKAGFNTAISYMREDQQVNNGQSGSAQFRLGLYNVINADSIGIGLGEAVGSGSSAFSGTISYRMMFATNNSVAPVSYAKFRNADGISRMSLLALGVDTITDRTSLQANRGMMDLRGGVVDMLVDQIVLGQGRTNSASANGKDDIGALYFDWGTIDCNTLIAGNMKWTNNMTIAAYVIVGTNGTLVINNDLILGQTPADVTGFESQAAAVTGQVRVDNGGTLRANQVDVGQYSANNIIIVNKGGTLEISNNVANATRRLTALTANGALTLHITNNNTLIYTTNLVASGGIINIGSFSGPATTIPVISYADGMGESASFVAGSAPNGYTATVFNNKTANTIVLALVTGTPKTLVWKGYLNNAWDNSTANWLDAATLLHTNFTTGDNVVFDDSTSFFSINVSEDVVPGQSSGMTMTNELNDYIFTGPGGILGAAPFVKAGAKSVTIDNYTEISANVVQGAVICSGSGTIGSATVVTGASLSLSSGANTLANVVNAGSLTNAGTIAGSLTASGGSTINSGTVNGALSMETGTAVYNSGTFNAIGTTTITTNSALINAGTIYGTSLTVAAGGSLTDIVPGSPGVSPGSINVGTLIVNGTFNPGGNSIITTKVTDYGSDGNQTGSPNGRVQLNAGSFTIFRVNLTNSQPNTKLLSQNQVFGPSQNFKAINGCTLIITNVGPTLFAEGQAFKLFGQYYGDGIIAGAGLNSTNSYPAIQPATPGPGLAWDMSHLYFDGIISVVAASSTQVTLTNNSMTVSPSNIIVHLSWPADKVGGWVQQLNTTLTNGLSATNWVTPNGGYLTNLTSFSEVYLTNSLIADPNAVGSAVFYRFVYP